MTRSIPAAVLTAPVSPTRVMSAPILAALFLAELLSACDRPPRPISTTVRDSAGVRIVEHPTWTPPDAPLITVPAEPALTVGGAASDPDRELFLVNGAALLEDGRLVVVNAGTQEIRYYGPDSALRGSTGREGDGPGEYRSPRLVGILRGDSVLLYDDRHRRFSVLAPDGRFARSFQIEEDHLGLAEPVGLIPSDGAVMFSGDEFLVGLQEGLKQDTTPVTLVGLTGQVIHGDLDSRGREGDLPQCRPSLSVPARADAAGRPPAAPRRDESRT